MKLLYCTSKEIYKKNAQYYSIGSLPEFLSSLASFFEKIYLLAPINYNSFEIETLSEIFCPPSLEIIDTTKPAGKFLPHRYIWSFLNFRLFKEFQKKVDLVVMDSPFVFHLGYLQFISKPLVTLIGGDDLEISFLSTSTLKRSIIFWLKKLVEKQFLKKSVKIICVSENLKKKILKRYYLEKSRIEVIPIGIQTDIFIPRPSEEKKSIRKKLGLGENDLVIGFVASEISYPKGGNEVITVFSELRKKYSNLKFLLIGKPKIEIPKDSSVLHFDFVKREELPLFYNAMDIFLFPSKSEGAPKVVMEACACGIPVIATYTGGIPELFEKNYKFLVKVGDIQKMIALCDILLRDKKIREEIGILCREFIKKKFDFATLIKKTADFIKTNLDL